MSKLERVQKVIDAQKQIQSLLENMKYWENQLEKNKDVLKMLAQPVEFDGKWVSVEELVNALENNRIGVNYIMYADRGEPSRRQAEEYHKEKSAHLEYQARVQQIIEDM